MQDYEMYHEIINQCPLNHSRDQFIEEIRCENPDSYLQEIFRKEADVRMEKTMLEDGSISYEVFASGLHHRFTFTAF